MYPMPFLGRLPVREHLRPQPCVPEIFTSRLPPGWIVEADDDGVAEFASDCHMPAWEMAERINMVISEVIRIDPPDHDMGGWGKKCLTLRKCVNLPVLGEA
jgi:hypothetical protein